MANKAAAQNGSVRSRRALGVDYGSRSVGIAVTTLGLSPRPLTVLKQRGPNASLGAPAYSSLAEEVLHTANAHSADTVVIGIPYAGEAEQTAQESACSKFAKQVASTLCRMHSQSKPAECAAVVRVATVDESWSTLEADKTLQMLDGKRRRAEKRGRDAMAAAVILDNFFTLRTGGSIVLYERQFPILRSCNDAAASAEEFEARRSDEESQAASSTRSGFARRGRRMAIYRKLRQL